MNTHKTIQIKNVPFGVRENSFTYPQFNLYDIVVILKLNEEVQKLENIRDFSEDRIKKVFDFLYNSIILREDDDKLNQFESVSSEETGVLKCIALPEETDINLKDYEWLETILEDMIIETFNSVDGVTIAILPRS